jgi:hypothetical protein
MCNGRIEPYLRLRTGSLTSAIWAGIFCAGYPGVGHLDREIHGVDIMENVFRGVQLLSDGTQTGWEDTDIVNLDLRAWVAGPISAVRISVLDPDD